jgi:outer membrane biosynthesis protein TonB
MARLERDAADAVKALGSARTPDDGAAERAWVLMQQRLVGGPPPIDIEAESRLAVARVRWIATGIAIAAVLVIAVGVASWSAGWLAAVDAHTPAEAPYSTTRTEPSEDTATAREPVIEVEPAPEVSVPTPPTIAESDAPAKPAKATKSPRRAEPEPEPEPPAGSAAKTTTLAAEMRLLGRANAALRSGDPAAALAVLDEHARDFARGQLAPEREYKRALALCELGRAAKARAVADAFVKAHPRSPLRSKAETVCREEDAQ